MACRNRSRRKSQRRNFFALDATCPLVTKVHREAEIHFKRGREIVLIGHAGHPEVVGTLGQLPDGAITLVQTVEEAEALHAARRRQARLCDADHAVARRHRRHRRGRSSAGSPTIVAPHKEDICYATTNRQEAVKRVAPQVDALVVVGAPNSSNSRRLQEVAERAGCRYSVLVQRAADIDWSRFGGVKTLGVTAGASAPEVLVEEILDAFADALHAQRRDRVRRRRIRHVLPAAAPASQQRRGLTLSHISAVIPGREP